MNSSGRVQGCVSWSNFIGEFESGFSSVGLNCGVVHFEAVAAISILGPQLARLVYVKSDCDSEFTQYFQLAESKKCECILKKRNHTDIICGHPSIAMLAQSLFTTWLFYREYGLLDECWWRDGGACPSGDLADADLPALAFVSSDYCTGHVCR